MLDSIPDAVNCTELCKEPSQCRHLKQKKDPLFGDRKGTTKKLCDKDFAERSGELSGAMGLKTLVLQGNDR